MSAYTEDVTMSILYEMTEEVTKMAHAVINNEAVRRHNPKLMSKRVGAEDLFRLAGAQNLYFRIFPLNQAPVDHPGHELTLLIDKAWSKYYWF